MSNKKDIKQGEISNLRPSYLQTIKNESRMFIDLLYFLGNLCLDLRSVSSFLNDAAKAIIQHALWQKMIYLIIEYWKIKIFDIVYEYISKIWPPPPPPLNFFFKSRQDGGNLYLDVLSNVWYFSISDIFVLRSQWRLIPRWPQFD